MDEPGNDNIPHFDPDDYIIPDEMARSFDYWCIVVKRLLVVEGMAPAFYDYEPRRAWDRLKKIYADRGEWLDDVMSEKMEAGRSIWDFELARQLPTIAVNAVGLFSRAYAGSILAIPYFSTSTEIETKPLGGWRAPLRVILGKLGLTEQDMRTWPQSKIRLLAGTRLTVREIAILEQELALIRNPDSF
jgi:hypothetical protein